MGILYTFGILIYKFIIRLAVPFNEKAAKFVAGRKHVFSVLKEKIDPESRYIWVHVASLGEFEQGRPVMETIRKQHPEYKILLTFFSPSGYEVQKNYQGADIISYLPMDTGWNARKFIRIVKPSVAIFIKYEFWVNYMTQLKKHEVPTYIVSAIFRESQAFFKWYGGWYRKILLNYNCLFVQDQHSVDLLKSIGIKNVFIAGDTRCDRVSQIARKSKDLPAIQSFKDADSRKIVVVGSSWSKDEELVISYFNRHPNLKMIIAPHEIGEERIREIMSKLKRPFVRYTRITESDVADTDCIILDCIGVLSSVYRYGEIAYVGGGFGSGIHNILEAAVYGIPVIFGPNYKKFREAVEITAVGGGYSVTGQEELDNILDELLNPDSDLLKNTSEIAGKFVNSSCGATNHVVEKIFSDLNNRS
jgi:3-deoxy-D-manno-octulosonic-acid transferase